MDFDLSTEQQLLKDSVEKFIQDEYEFAKRQAIASSDDGFNRKHWKTFAELGWLAMPLPEAYGGLGGSATDTMVLMEAFGSALVAEPYLSTVVLGAGLIREAGSEAQKNEMLPQIGAGDLLVAFAYAEPQARYELSNIRCRAERTTNGWRLDGAKSVVLHGPSADNFIVTARTAGEPRDRDGISLFVVDAKTPGVERMNARAFDQAPVCELTLAGVELPETALLGTPGAAIKPIEHVVDEGIAAVCAEAVGAMGAVHAATTEYLKTREQFGQPIGRFQVLQHRMVDMFIELEQSRSLTYLVTLKMGANEEERRKAASCAKAQVSKAGKFVGAEAVQLHGGMGMTDELAISHYYKHLMLIDILFGNADHHRREFTRLTQ